MISLFWYIVARILSTKWIVDYLIVRARRTPYSPIMSVDGKEIYMDRFWLFNPYLSVTEKEELKAAGKKEPWQFPISIRLHCIRKEDLDRHQHDHPWNARTILLRGSYIEQRGIAIRCLQAGDTSQLRFGKDYHRISHVFPEYPEVGVWTFFITYKFQGMWGFNVNGTKVPFRQYLRETGDAMSKEKSK